MQLALLPKKKSQCLPILSMMAWVMVQRWFGQEERSSLETWVQWLELEQLVKAWPAPHKEGWASEWHTNQKIISHWESEDLHVRTRALETGRAKVKKRSWDNEIKSWCDKSLVCFAVVSRVTIHWLNAEDVRKKKSHSLAKKTHKSKIWTDASPNIWMLWGRKVFFSILLGAASKARVSHWQKADEQRKRHINFIDAFNFTCMENSQKRSENPEVARLRAYLSFNKG